MFPIDVNLRRLLFNDSSPILISRTTSLTSFFFDSPKNYMNTSLRIYMTNSLGTLVTSAMA
jgi:hypothetical protein